MKFCALLVLGLALFVSKAESAVQKGRIEGQYGLKEQGSNYGLKKSRVARSLGYGLKDQGSNYGIEGQYGLKEQGPNYGLTVSNVALENNRLWGRMDPHSWKKQNCEVYSKIIEAV